MRSSSRSFRSRTGDAGREELYKELSYKDQAESACLVLESDKVPPQEVIDKVARDTGLPLTS